MKNVIRRQTLGDVLRRTALRVPSKTAIICGSTHWTYAEFDGLVSRLAAGLSQLGGGQGDRIAVLARNSHGFAAMRFALARLGAVLVPVNFMLNADEVAYILRHAGARILATDSDLAELARAAAALGLTEPAQVPWKTHRRSRSPLRLRFAAIECRVPGSLSSTRWSGSM